MLLTELKEKKYPRMRIILLGPPGSGKGTQAEPLAKHFKIPNISAGKMLRSEIKAGSKLGTEVQGYVEAGKLAPDELVTGMIRRRVAQKDCVDGFIIDGFPRDLAEGKLLTDAGIDIDFVIELYIHDDEIMRRLMKRKRADDEEKIIKKRISVFKAQIKPLARYYKDQEAVHYLKINGHGLAKHTQDNIIAAINLIIKKKKV